MQQDIAIFSLLPFYFFFNGYITDFSRRDMNKPRIGILTGGGDTVALNRSIETIKNMAYLLGYDILGIYGGWRGLLGDGYLVNISRQDINGQIGGSILGTSRTNPYKKNDTGNNRVSEVLRNIERYHLDVIVTIGGDDTNSVARKLWLDHQIPVIGFPKTIDNDLRTQTQHRFAGASHEVVLCPGFPSAAEKIARMTQEIRTTAMTHNRTFALEVMGRDAGWLAATSAHGGADLILVPEVEMTKERVDRFLGKVDDLLRKNRHLVIGVSEGVKWYNEETGQTELVFASQDIDEFGHSRLGGVSAKIAAALMTRKIDPGARSQISGYLPRAGFINHYDHSLTTALGSYVAKMLINKDYGKMPAMEIMGNFREMEAYNAHAVDMGSIGNFPLPIDIYYDEKEFNVTDAYRDFLEKILGEKYKLPRMIEYQRVVPAD